MKSVINPCPHQPLHSDKSFRLLNLRPEAEGIPVVTILEEVSLNEHPDYEAISYTWGSSADQQEITLNEHTTSIRKHLYSFLQRLRHANKARRLWVDALCISQTDLVEKAQQVSIIGAIFERAQRVLVWLGEHADGSERLFQGQGFRFSRLRSCYSDYKSHGGGSVRQYQLTEAALEEARYWGRIWKAFLGRSYWSRTWVVQELAVARATILHCGINCGRWRDIVEKPVDDLRLVLIRKLVLDDDHDMNGFWVQIKSWQLLRSMRHGDGLVARYLPPFAGQHRVKDGIGIVRLLRLMRDTACLIPHDRIYACLSLTTQTIRDNVPPDYTIDVPTLWTRIILAKNMDSLDEHLSIISEVLEYSMPINVEGLRQVARCILEARGRESETAFLDEVLRDIERITRNRFNDWHMVGECCQEVGIDRSALSKTQGQWRAPTQVLDREVLHYAVI